MKKYIKYFYFTGVLVYLTGCIGPNRYTTAKQFMEKAIHTLEEGKKKKYFLKAAQLLEYESEVNPFFMFTLYSRLVYLEDKQGNRDLALINYFKARYWVLKYREKYSSSLRLKYAYDNLSFQKCKKIGKSIIKLNKYLKK